MRYPRIPQNIAVKFRRGVALGMTAVMLLTGTPATSITSHATETTGTEVTTQEQTSGTEQATSEAVTTEAVTEIASTEATTTETVSTEASTEAAVTEAVTTEVTTQEQASTEATTEEAKVSKKKSKTEETVEELNKQTNNSKYTGNVTSSYSWTDSSGTHFRWSVQKKGSGHQNAYCLRHGRHMGNEVSAAAANVGQMAGKYGFSMAILMRLVNDGKLPYTDAQYSIWANCNTGKYVSYTDYVWKLHPDNANRKAGTSVGYPKTVTPVSNASQSDMCGEAVQKATANGTVQQITKKSCITANGDNTKVLSVNSAVIPLNSNAWTSLAKNESGLGSSVSVVGIYKNDGAWSAATNGSATLNGSANKLTVSYSTDDGAYGVPGNPMVVLVKVHAPNAGGGIEYLSWGTAEWDGQSELQSLAVGTYGTSEDFYYAIPVFATTQPTTTTPTEGTLKIYKRDNLGNDVSLKGGQFVVYRYNVSNPNVADADCGWRTGETAATTGWTFTSSECSASRDGVNDKTTHDGTWCKNYSADKVKYSDGNYHYPAQYHYFYRLQEITPPEGCLGATATSYDIYTDTGSENGDGSVTVNVNAVHRIYGGATLATFYINKDGEITYTSLGPGQQSKDALSGGVKHDTEKNPDVWFPNIGGSIGPATSDWTGDPSSANSEFTVINRADRKSGRVVISKKLLRLMTGYDKATKTAKYEDVPVPFMKFHLYAKTDIGISGMLQSTVDNTWSIPYTYPILSKDQEVTTGCADSTVWKTKLNHSIYANSATSVNGSMSWENLPPGTYYITEEIDRSVSEFQYIDAPTGRIEATVHEDGTTTYTIDNKDVNALDQVINNTQPFQCHVSKVDKGGNGLEGAEFTLYADVNMTNVLGNRVFSDSDAEDAIIAVENGQPVYESGKWVPIATAKSDASGNVNFKDATGSYQMNFPYGKYLIAETGTPDNYKRVDYKKGEYEFSHTYNAQVGSNGSYKNFKVTNEEAAGLKIKIYKYGELLTGAELKETDYGKYYELKRTKDTPFNGVDFGIYEKIGEGEDATEKLIEIITTSDNGTAMSRTKLKSGVTYIVKEIDNGGELLMDENWKQEVVLEKDEVADIVVKPVDFDNTQIPVKLHIYKTGEQAVLSASKKNEDKKDESSDTTDTDNNANAGSQDESDTATLGADNNDKTTTSSVDISGTTGNETEDGKKELSVVEDTFTFDTTKLAGVVFGIYTKDDIKSYDGKVIVPADSCVGIATTDENGVATFDANLVSGSYYYKEIKTADSTYIKDNQSYPFTIDLKDVDKDTKTLELDINKDEPLVNKLYKGSIHIVKTGGKTSVPLEGVKFGLYDENEALIGTAVTDKEGNITWSNLPAGKYYVKELETIKDYILDESTYTFNITPSSLHKTKNIVNKKIQGKIKVIKRDADNKTTVLGGVTFELLDKDKKVIGLYQTGEDGTFTTEDLDLGTYYIREKETLAGYILDNTEHEIDLTESNKFPELEILNQVKYGSIKVIKTDGTKTVYLQGVVFNLYDANHNLIGTYTTNEQGEIFVEKLRIGTYYLQETVTNEGFLLDDSVYQIDLTDSNLDQILHLVNEELTNDDTVTVDTDTKTTHHVKTGDVFTLFVFMVMALSVIGFVTLTLLKRREEAVKNDEDKE